MKTNAVYLGNCMELIRDLPKDREIVLVTDPPFNIGYHYGQYDDDMDEADYYKMLKALYDAVGGKAVFIHYPEALHRLSIELKAPPSRVVAWVYNSNTPRQHRDICYYGFSPNMAQVTQEYKNPNDARIAERMERGIMGGKQYDWIEENQIKNISKEKYDHPCQMPLRVMAKVIGVIPKENNPIILDPFAGTGTTLVAARDLGYDFIGFEIDPKYKGIADMRLKDRTPAEIKAKIEQLKLF